tara:strand:- start:4 stop:426 length:423 start_codon:yes stop_codon:yes gene_type:complete
MAFIQNFVITDVDSVQENIGFKLPFTLETENISTTTLESTKTNLTNLLLTEKGERVFQPGLGVELRKHLFNQITSENIVSLQEDIIEQIAIWLPFLKVSDVIINESPAESLLKIEIKYSFKNNNQLTDSVQVDLSTGASY